MILTLKIFLSIILLIIFYQDAKTRLVYLILYAFAGGASILLFLLNNSYPEFFLSIVLNLSFLVILGGCTTIYFLLRKKSIEFIKNSIGSGDLIFFLILTLSFPFMRFIYFFACSLLFSIVVHWIFEKKESIVPLAGYMSVFYVLILVVTSAIGFNLYTS